MNIADFTHAVTDNLDKRRNFFKKQFVIQAFLKYTFAPTLVLKKYLASYFFVSSCATAAFMAFGFGESEFCHVYVY